MHFPVSIPLGDFSVKLHTVTEVLAYFAGFRYYLYLRKRQGDPINDENRIWIILGAIGGALAGSRLVGGFENPEALKQSGNVWVHFFANKSIAGGLLGGLWGVEIIKKIIGENRRSGDLFVFPILLAMVIGRLGCLSMGVYEDVFGKPTSFFTGMNLGDGIRRHPLMLYELIYLVFTWRVLAAIKKNHHPAPGVCFRWFMISYLVFRLCIETLKEHQSYLFNLGAIQIACLLGLLYYGRYILNPSAWLQTVKQKP